MAFSTSAVCMHFSAYTLSMSSFIIFIIFINTFCSNISSFWPTSLFIYYLLLITAVFQFSAFITFGILNCFTIELSYGNCRFVHCSRISCCCHCSVLSWIIILGWISNCSCCGCYFLIMICARFLLIHFFLLYILNYLFCKLKRIR